MNTITQFEDLCNEIFLEVFEYLHCLDLFMAFASLNNRFTFLLSLPQLYLIVNQSHFYYQIQFLSSHLVDHAHQVISISFHEQLCDYFASVISFFFDKHTFKNLRSCIFIFHLICLPWYLPNITEKLKNSNKLVLFKIFYSNNNSLADKIKEELSTFALKCKSLKLRSVNLLFSYNYPKLLVNNSINSTLTTLRMMFHGVTTICSIYSFLPVLRIYRALRNLSISISNQNNQQIIMPTLPAIYEINPPILSSLKSFELCTKTFCSFQSLSFILHCMPNLRRFILTIISLSSSISNLHQNLFRGGEWEILLKNGPSQLDIFDIFLHIQYTNFELDMNFVVNSFNYFTRKYNDWYLAIHQSQCNSRSEKRYISLRGFRRSKKTRHYFFNPMRIVLGTLNIYSTSVIDNQHDLFYSMYKDLHVNIPVNTNMSNILSYGQIFKNINYLTLEIDSSILTFWKKILDFCLCNPAEIYQKDCADKITSLIDLTTITKLEFKSKSNIYFIKDILLACSHLTQLKIRPSLLLYDDPSLTSVFHQLKSLYLLSNHCKSFLKYAFKLVEHFSSLIHLELEIYSTDLCISLLNILLDGLPKLIHLKIYFRHAQVLPQDADLTDYILQRRRKAFPLNIYNEHEVWIIMFKQLLDIYLNNCLICADEKCSI
ncbi:unnamed protein product [Adineta steineri]|uniref:F-box domain-containing protein n=3 Tax=Adineta steineri TaxID=433720 RepID=A0A814RZM5_9BILA|nr:unnamed protein product [Adineta steineri]